MASDDGGGGEAEASHGPQECMPCRGTGRVVSNLGGTASKITCPWCEGDGARKPEIDAQSHWSSGEGAGAPTAAAADEAA
jgi:DnaJ-class molecular chaperone